MAVIIVIELFMTGPHSRAQDGLELVIQVLSIGMSHHMRHDSFSATL